MAIAIFVSTDDVKRFTALNGNVDVDKFIQFVKIAQDIYIQNYLGTKLFNKISADILDSDLQEPYLSLVNDYIKPMVIQWTMVEYLPYASYIIGNKGLYKHGAENSQNIDKSEVDFLIEKARDTAQHYTRRFIDFMCFNSSDFPEYLSNSNNDVYPDKNADYGGWYL
jgi:hypothetical protein